MFASCSSNSELETGEIKTIELIKKAIDDLSQPKVFIDSKQLLSRDKIDSFKSPILYVELDSGQNGTLTLYPGQGVAQTWIGADGATITLDGGVLKASRGMGDDLMGSSSSMPPWVTIKNEEANYLRKLHYLTGNNKISLITWDCKIKKHNRKETLVVWEVKFTVTKYLENCLNNEKIITNIYYLDKKNIVRKSLQYHSETVGHILTERLDRL